MQLDVEPLDIDTDVIMPMYSCTDVTVQDVYYRFLEYQNRVVAGTDVIMPLGFLDVLNPTDHSL